MIEWMIAIQFGLISFNEPFLSLLFLGTKFLTLGNYFHCRRRMTVIWLECVHVCEREREREKIQRLLFSEACE